MRKYVCNEAGCRELLDAPGRCGKHARRGGLDYSKMKRTNEGLYNTWAWRKLRKAKREETGYCELCGAEDERLDVHHRVAPRGDKGLFYDYNNLVCLCRDCHNDITRAEGVERRRREREASDEC
jgi:5-methylcytosine-specific restriction endonuclease McrA